jgi:hypothetical protein
MTAFYVAQLPRWVMSVLVALVIAAGGVRTDSLAQQGRGQTAKEPTAVTPDAAVHAEFTAKVDEYLALQKKLEQDLPRLPKEATREEIFQRQQELLKRLQAARREARQGDIFTPKMQEYVRRMMAKLFAGPAGAQLRASIMDENPVSVKLRVNMAYPTEVPLATMPPTVLASLPKTPEVLEYRFIGDDLILLDTRAQMIADFVAQALPK